MVDSKGWPARAGALFHAHRRAALSSFVTVLVLALLITVGSALQARRPAPDESADTSGLSTEARSRSELDEARVALESGEITRAVGLLEAVIAAEPSNSEARKLLEAAKPAPQSPTLDDPDDPAIQPADYLDPVSDLASLLPASVAGYSIDNADIGSEQGALTLTPAPGAAQTGQVRVVLMTVYDFKSPDAAAAFIAGQTKAFPISDRSVTIGTFPGRFGADAARIAAVSFARGRYAFEVVLTAEEPDATRFESHMIELAGTFPAAR